MPELPEVETIVRQLAPLLQGQRIVRLELLDPRLGELSERRLRGCTIARVLRVGKQVMLELERAGSRSWLVIHLRMTGRLVWSNAAKTADPQHLRARLLLRGGRGVLYYDVRRFGTIKLHLSLDETRSTGVDPLARDFSEAGLRRLLGRSRQAIKPWLLRQDRLAGLGNIYASEILFEARIDPLREVRSLTRGEVGCLHRSMRRVLRRAIRHCGTTFSDFQDARGLTGSYQRYLKVYGRQGESCSVCCGPLRRVIQQQRSTFFCPQCQR